MSSSVHHYRLCGVQSVQVTAAQNSIVQSVLLHV
jgi:hypothetical protein